MSIARRVLEAAAQWFGDDASRAAMAVGRPWRLAATGLAIAMVLTAATAFWGTAVSTSQARISVLRTVEPYGFAVHEQLVRNYAETGQFRQTIHRGYDDSWTWSGHRALTLITTSWIYPLAPSVHGLSRIQILGVLLGIIPMALLGRRAMGSGWGLAVGGLLYLGAPAVMALALQDYQDLVFALPCLAFALWAFGSRRWWLAPLGALVGILPREECVLLTVAAAAVVVPPPLAGRRWKRWLVNVALTGAIVGAYVAYVMARHPVSFQGEIGGGHDMPAVNASLSAVEALLSGELPGMQKDNGFYALLFAPFGALALLSPATAAPGLLLVLLHLTVPEGHGVDRLWGGHSHHMAPAVVFLVAGAVQGAGRLLRVLAGWPWRRAFAAAAGWRRWAARLGPVVAAVAACGFLVYGLYWYANWAAWFNLATAWWPREPPYEHPAWALSRQLPDDAAPAVFLDASITVSNRELSYTYEESLDDKEPERGLGAATHMIVDRRNTAALARGMDMPGVEVLATDGDYSLLTWPPGAEDPSLAGGGDPSTAQGDRGQPLNVSTLFRWHPKGVGDFPGCPARDR